MIDCYSWPTPNGHKVHIMLEETGLPYTVVPVDIGQGDQFQPDFLKISPNNKMPAIVDRDGPGGREISVFETGAILIYLANKAGMLLPQEPHAYYDVLQWLMFQMASVGPMLGQAHHFNVYALERFPEERIAYGRERYVNEANRIYGVLDSRLKGRAWIAADAYTIADVATVPWLRAPERQGVDIDDYPEVRRWRAAVLARPAVERGFKVLADRERQGPRSDKEWEMLYGRTQVMQGRQAPA